MHTKCIWKKPLSISLSSHLYCIYNGPSTSLSKHTGGTFLSTNKCSVYIYFIPTRNYTTKCYFIICVQSLFACCLYLNIVRCEHHHTLIQESYSKDHEEHLGLMHTSEHHIMGAHSYYSLPFNCPIRCING